MENNSMMTLPASNEILPLPCQDIRSVLTCSKPQISTISRTHGVEVLNKSIMALIVMVRENISVGKTMNENQIRFAGSAIAEKFWYLKLEDVALCFRRGILGEYGKLYDRLDVQILCDWIQQYEQERNNECAKLQRDNGQEYSRNVYDVIGSEKMKELLHKVVDANEKKIQGAPAPPPAPKSDFEIQVLQEWDGLESISASEKLYEGKPYTLAAYGAYRAMQLSGKI